MGWKDAFNYAKKPFTKPEVHEDTGLPLGAKIGSIISFSSTPFIKFQLAGSICRSPVYDKAQIVAVSRLHVPINGRLFRYYIDAGGNSENTETYIQVYENAAGNVDEVIYFDKLARHLPQSYEEMEVFTGVARCGVGEQAYCLDTNTLTELCNLSPSVVSQACGEAGAVEYHRAWADSSEAYSLPFYGNEERIDDCAGLTGLKQNVIYAPYVRNLSSDISGGSLEEHLSICTEISSSTSGTNFNVDNLGSIKSIHVDFMVGIPLELSRIQIL